MAAFKRHLLARPSRTTSLALSASTVVHILGSLNAFFVWLKDQRGHRRMDRDVASYFTPSRALIQQAQIPSTKYAPTPEEIHCVVDSMPTKNFGQRRDRALIAFLFLTGIRDGAVIGVRLKHLDVDQKLLRQDPTEMKTKNSKWIETPWYPVDTWFETVVTDWVLEMRGLGADDDAPLFPTAVKRFGRSLTGLAFESWKTAAPLREILKAATKRAGVPYFKPHAIRTTLGTKMYEWPRNMEELLALSEGLGHVHLRTTLHHYVDRDLQKRLAIFKNIRERNAHPADDIQSIYERATPELREAVKLILKSVIRDPVV